jgi:ATP-dependent protease Clp ATPase subunit
MGFLANKINKRESSLSVEDLYSSGVAKEFLGRISSVISLKPLTSEDIYLILHKSHSSPIKKYINKIELHGCQVCVPESTYKSIATSVANHPLGVRSIDFILKRIFKKALFEAPLSQGKTYAIDYF